MLCPGAEPIRPPIPGADDPRVDVLRNIPDMDRIIAQLDKDATRAVVVGGSYIGLELTEAFKARGWRPPSSSGPSGSCRGWTPR